MYVIFMNGFSHLLLQNILPLQSNIAAYSIVGIHGTWHTGVSDYW